MPFRALIERLMSRHQAAISGFAVMSLKGTGSLLTLAIFTVAARAMSAHEFGRLAVWFNTMSFLSVAALFGQDTLISRSWGEYSGAGDLGQARGAYRFGWIMTAVSVTIFLVAFWLIAPVIDQDMSKSDVAAAAFFMLMHSLLYYSSQSSRVMVGFIVSETGREIIWRSLLLVVVIWGAVNGGLTQVAFFTAAGIGIVISLAMQLSIVWRRVLSKPTQPRQDDRRQWLIRSLNMWLSSIVEAASQFADVIVVGYFASAAVAGDYFAAARIASLFLLVGGGINIYAYAHSSKLYFSGQLEKLQHILRSLVVVVTVISTPCLILIVMYGREILMIFGERYVSAYAALVTLSLGAYVMALSGSPSVILLTTGYERVYSRIIVAATIVRMALIAILASTMGPAYVALAWAFVNAPVNIILSIICRTRLGVDPTILSLFSASRGASEKLDRSNVGAVR